MKFTKAPTIDSGDPLFIGESNVSGATLIKVKLIGSMNYRVWSLSMRIALLGKRKFLFVTYVYSREMYREELHK